MQFRASASFLLDSESDVRHQQRQAEAIIRPSVPFCFGVARGLFLVDSESDVRHQQRQAEVTSRPSVQCCFGVAKGFVLEAYR